MVTTKTDTPRIWAGCLAAYNNGILHGEWIDIDGLTADEIGEAVAAVLAASPIPGAEEHFIADYDGFGGMNLGEWESFERIAELGGAIEEYGLDVVAAFHGNDPSADLASIGDAYLGEWDSLADYVEDFHESCGTDLGTLAAYIDWEKVARDWEYNGDVWTATSSDYKVLIFSSNY